MATPPHDSLGAKRLGLLRELRPGAARISHKVPGPFGLDEKPAIFRMTILPPEKVSQHD
jgi:hypothetical protein